MTKGQEDEKKNLNNETRKDSKKINRGVELLLRNKKRRVQSPKIPKTFQIKFEKIISLFQRDIQISFNFYLDFKKKSLGE